MKIISKSHDQHMENEIENEIEDVLDVLNSEKKTQNMSKAKDTENIPLPFDTPEFVAIWAEWLQYRKERRFGAYTPTGLKRTFNKLLADCGGRSDAAVQIVDQSISNNWQGLFPLKPVLNGKKNQREPSTVGKTIEFDRP